jgi:glycosyltransferase, group 2 family protein
MTQDHAGLDVECFVVDDCGSDNSMDVVRQTLRNYDGDIRFSIIRHEKNMGQSAARNSGIRASKGSYIMFVDSDDRLLAGALKGMALLVDKYPGVDIIQGGVQLNKPNKGLESDICISSATLPEYVGADAALKRIVLFDMPVTSWAKLIRRELIVANKLFFKEGMVHEDDMWNICASRYIKSVAFYFTPAYHYNNGIPNSIISNIDKTLSLVGRTAIISTAAECYAAEPSLEYYEYLAFKLDFATKAEIWQCVKDYKTANRAIAEMRKNLRQANCPMPLRLSAWYFSLPYSLGSNRFILPLFRRLSRLIKKQYIRKLIND